MSPRPVKKIFLRPIYISMIRKLFAYIIVYLYNSQTTEPNGLTFFEGTTDFFFQNSNFFSNFLFSRTSLSLQIKRNPWFSYIKMDKTMHNGHVSDSFSLFMFFFPSFFLTLNKKLNNFNMLKRVIFCISYVSMALEPNKD